MTSEKSIENNIKSFLDSLDDCYYEKRHGGFFSSNGQPDISGCISGRRFELEVKKPGESPRPLQKSIMKKWKNAGAVTGVARGVDDVKALFRDAGLV